MDKEQKLKKAKALLFAMLSRIKADSNSALILYNATIIKIRQALIKGGDISAILGDFKKQLKKIIEEDMGYAIENVSSLEDEDSNNYLFLIPSILEKDKVIDSIERYSNIIQEETDYFSNKNFPLQEYPLFMKNPKAYISLKKGSLVDLSDSIPSMDSGISWGLVSTLTGLIMFNGMKAYNNTFFSIWRKHNVKYYYAVRGSNYPCSLCDSYVGVPIPLDAPLHPLHNRCCCIIYQMENDLIF